MTDDSALPATAKVAPRPTWGLLEVLLVALPLLALTVFSQVNGSGAPPRTRPVNPLFSALFLSVVEAALLLPVWLLAILKAHGSWRAVGFRRFDTSLGCTLPVVYLFIALVSSAVWGALLQVFNLPTQPEIAPLFGTNALAIAFGYLGAAIVAPIAEETIFRGFVIGGLRNRFGVAAALVVSAVLFALLHPPLTIFPVIFVLGLLLGLLFIQTGSLYPGMLMHAMFNTIGFIAQVVLSTNS